MTKQKQTPAIYAFNKKPGDGAHHGVDSQYDAVVDELMRALDSGLDFVAQSYCHGTLFRAVFVS